MNLQMKAYSLLMSLLALNPCYSDQKELQDIAVDAYVYGYPLVTMAKTCQVMTNVATPDAMKAPMGQFFHARQFPTPAFKDVATPNADTLYSVAWLDLTNEPYVLSVPDEHGRYYLMPMLSGWTDVFEAPGTRTSGTQARAYAILGPNWHGTPPPGTIVYRSPTNLVWILGRTYSSGTAADLAAVQQIQDEYSLVPLSAYGKPYTPPQGTVDPSIDMKTPVRDQVNAMDGVSFFTQLAKLMITNPPAPEDGPMLARLSKIGIVAGREFDPKAQTQYAMEALNEAPKLAQEQILKHIPKAGKVINGWVIGLHTGLYGTDYLQRAAVAYAGLGANRPQDVVHPYTNVDSTGKPLTGQHKYVVHFEKGKTPPVRGFWSLTMLDLHMFFVANPLNRYTISARNALKYNPDGSLDLYIQNESPGEDKESNWLPAPKDHFNLMLRLYWPDDEVIDGAWVPPAVKLTN